MGLPARACSTLGRSERMRLPMPAARMTILSMNVQKGYGRPACRRAVDGENHEAGLAPLPPRVALAALRAPAGLRALEGFSPVAGAAAPAAAAPGAGGMVAAVALASWPNCCCSSFHHASDADCAAAPIACMPAST